MSDQATMNWSPQQAAAIDAVALSDRARWLYTGLTRAADKITVVM